MKRRTKEICKTLMILLLLGSVALLSLTAVSFSGAEIPVLTALASRLRGGAYQPPVKAQELALTDAAVPLLITVRTEAGRTSFWGAQGEQKGVYETLGGYLAEALDTAGEPAAVKASVLEAAGYRVGLNTSPHLERFHERIRVNGEEISDEALGAVMDRVRPAAEAMAEHPTEFELITAAAFLHFQEQVCDIVVLETGLGGALDASNVIETPELAVLTAMGMDHAAILGPTLRDIAAAKAGIIKPGGTVVSRGGCPEADEVFRQVCQERGADLTELDLSRLRVRRLNLEGAVFDFAPWEDLTIPLAGEGLSVADVYDALVCERVYKAAFPKDKAFEMILNGECGTFSPKLMESFKKVKEKFEKLVG